MFAKFIHRHDVSEDAVLGDIIPSNESIENPKTKSNKIRKFCTILSCIFMLGLIAIGIVLLVFIFVYSHNALINFLVQPLRTNRTQIGLNDSYLESNINLNQTQWKRVTVLPELTTSTTSTTKGRRKLVTPRRFNTDLDDMIDELFFS